ncbi:DUF1566 domain-containing protein [Fastidiosibacter lacustris]|uniref:Lcl C-terminal domain-containing protein n=1 Tax=Fastidiosibacter lacustris TaxID=2056695 RepID=UPI000E34426A|nr:DUF1566 domain-containing protein [Fastidiosibacter lacustris]
MKNIQHRIIKKIGLLSTLLIFLGVASQSFAYDVVIQADDAAFRGDGQWPTPRFVEAIGADGVPCSSLLRDKLTGLTWRKNAYEGRTNWQGAMNFAANFAKDHPISACGYTDWRVPNINELRSLVNYGAQEPNIWLNANGFNNFQDTAGYWTSTEYGPDKDQAWLVDMGEGGTFFAPKRNGRAYVVIIR